MPTGASPAGVRPGDGDGASGRLGDHGFPGCDGFSVAGAGARDKPLAQSAAGARLYCDYGAHHARRAAILYIPRRLGDFTDAAHRVSRSDLAAGGD